MSEFRLKPVFIDAHGVNSFNGHPWADPNVTHINLSDVSTIDEAFMIVEPRSLMWRKETRATNGTLLGIGAQRYFVDTPRVEFIQTYSR